MKSYSFASALVVLIFAQASSQRSAVPFLRFNPEARAQGFGNIGSVSPEYYPGSQLYDNPYTFNSAFTIGFQMNLSRENHWKYYSRCELSSKHV